MTIHERPYNMDWVEACAAVVDEDRSTMMGLALSIARKHGTTLRTMRSMRRGQVVEAARRDFYIRAAFDLCATNSQIAKFMGDRDESTIWSALHPERGARRKRRAAA